MRTTRSLTVHQPWQSLADDDGSDVIVISDDDDDDEEFESENGPLANLEHDGYEAVVGEEGPDTDMTDIRSETVPASNDRLIEAGDDEESEFVREEDEGNSPFTDYDIYVLRSDGSWEPIETDEDNNSLDDKEEDAERLFTASELLEKIDELARCPICLSVKAKTVICSGGGHLACCVDCVEVLWASDDSTAAYTDDGLEMERRAICPLCGRAWIRKGEPTATGRVYGYVVAVANPAAALKEWIETETMGNL